MNLHETTPLLGTMPEQDSTALITLIRTLEERVGILVDDDVMTGGAIAAVTSLCDFVAGQIAA